MAEKIYLETTELESIASSLKTKGNSINDEFTNSCYAALEMCSKCLEITGLDTNQFFESFKTIYSNISIRCGNLSKFISETIIPSYNEVTNAITKNFNNELGDKIASIIGIGSSSAALGVSSAPETNSVVQQEKEEVKVTEAEKNSVSNEKAHENSNKKVNTDTVFTKNDNLEKNIEENIPEPVQEEPIEEPIVQTESEIVEEQPVLKGEALLSSLGHETNGTIKKGLGIGLGLAGVGTAVGTTGYIINSNREKEKEEENNKNKNK